MKIDAKFNELGLQGWNPFKEYFLNIWKLFIRYGEEILRVDLGESIEIYKGAFIQAHKDEAKFIASIRKIWEERYHYVACNLEQLTNFYEMAKNQGIKFNSLLPEINDDEGINETFSLSIELYDFIFSKMILENKREVYVYKEDGNFYKLSFYRGVYKSSYRKIEMEEVEFLKTN